MNKDGSLSVAKFVNNCIKRAIPLDRIPELFKLKQEFGNNSFDWDLYDKLKDKSHVRWRYILIKKRYKKACLNRYVLVYGRSEGTRLWGETKKKYASSSFDKWVERCGGDVEEAKRQMKKYDSSSLDYYTNKYGEDEGRRLFDEYVQHKSIVSTDLYESGTTKFKLNIHDFQTYLDFFDTREEAEVRFERDKAHWSSRLFTKERLINEGVSENEIAQTFRSNNRLCLEYYAKHNIPESEAKRIIGDIQRRDLEFFVTKYGEEYGHQKWVEKTEKWQAAFYGKPVEELIKINQRKGNRHETVDGLETVDGRLYLLYHKDGKFLKVGITMHTVERRYPNFNNTWVKLLDCEMTLKEAKDLESSVLKRFRKFKTRFDAYPSIETFGEEVCGYLVRYINSKTKGYYDELSEKYFEDAEERVCVYG